MKFGGNVNNELFLWLLVFFLNCICAENGHVEVTSGERQLNVENQITHYNTTQVPLDSMLTFARAFSSGANSKNRYEHFEDTV